MADEQVRYFEISDPDWVIRDILQNPTQAREWIKCVQANQLIRYKDGRRAEYGDIYLRTVPLRALTLVASEALIKEEDYAVRYCQEKCVFEGFDYFTLFYDEGTIKAEIDLDEISSAVDDLNVEIGRFGGNTAVFNCSSLYTAEIDIKIFNANYYIVNDRSKIKVADSRITRLVSEALTRAELSKD